MGDPEQSGPLDRAVELLARVLDALGFNGTRVRWRWNRRKRNMAESSARASVMLRTASSRHKMCRACRALVPRSSGSCPECGASLSGVSAPGVSRLLTNIFPGATTATSLLLLVNGALFLMMLLNSLQAQDGGGLLRFGGFTTLRYGSAHAVLVFQDGEWWRLATAIFLHGGLLHFGFNSWVLLQLGPLVESEFGTERFWVIYLCAGFLGNVLHVVLTQRAGVVGASGAIVGLVGLLISYGTRMRTVGGQNLKAAMMRFAFMILIISLLPGVSWQAHLGGFLTGLGLGWIVPTGRFRNRASAALWQGLSLAAVLVVLFCFYQVALHGTDALKYVR